MHTRNITDWNVSGWSLRSGSQCVHTPTSNMNAESILVLQISTNRLILNTVVECLTLKAIFCSQYIICPAFGILKNTPAALDVPSGMYHCIYILRLTSDGLKRLQTITCVKLWNYKPQSYCCWSEEKGIELDRPKLYESPYIIVTLPSVVRPPVIALTWLGGTITATRRSTADQNQSLLSKFKTEHQWEKSSHWSTVRKNPVGAQILSVAPKEKNRIKGLECSFLLTRIV